MKKLVLTILTIFVLSACNSPEGINSETWIEAKEIANSINENMINKKPLSEKETVKISNLMEELKNTDNKNESEMISQLSALAMYHDLYIRAFESNLGKEMLEMNKKSYLSVLDTLNKKYNMGLEFKENE